MCVPSPACHRLQIAAAATVMLAGVALSAAASAQESPPPPLAIVAVEVTPEDPGADTLCQLRVRVENRGERPVYALRFEVRLDGRSLPAYDQQLYYQQLPAGEVSEVRLFNFWTTETGRPAPADGKLRVEVVLGEASWLTVTQEQDPGSEQPVEVWTRAGAVGGLPVSRTVELEL
jgi:hypothetical protein